MACWPLRMLGPLGTVPGSQTRRLLMPLIIANRPSGNFRREYSGCRSISICSLVHWASGMVTPMEASATSGKCTGTVLQNLRLFDKRGPHNLRPSTALRTIFSSTVTVVRSRNRLPDCLGRTNHLIGEGVQRRGLGRKCLAQARRLIRLGLPKECLNGR